MKSGNEKWIRIYKNWKKSGLSRAEYCRQNGLAATTFHYWYKKIAQQDRDNPKNESDLVKVPVSLITKNDRSFTLEFSRNIKLKIPYGCPSEELKQMVTELKEIFI